MPGAVVAAWRRGSAPAAVVAGVALATVLVAPVLAPWRTVVVPVLCAVACQLARPPAPAGSSSTLRTSAFLRVTRAVTVARSAFVAVALTELGVKAEVVGEHWPPLVLTGGMVLVAAVTYQVLIHWNRYRTEIADPSDWLNGLSAVLALVALGTAILPAAHSGLSPLTATLWLVQAAVLVSLCGTAATTAQLAGLRASIRMLLLLGGTLVSLLAILATPWVSRHHGPAEVLIIQQVAWLGLVLAMSTAWRLPHRPAPPRRATSTATSIGSLVVLVASVLILVFNTIAGHDAAILSSVLAGLAALGGAARSVGMVRDLSQLAATRSEARTDDLTGAANRRALMEHLGSHTVATSLLLLDLDRFKDVNDRFGHTTGDELIVTVAQRLQRELPRHGVLARLGGDEFAIALPGTGPVEATRLAQHLGEQLAPAVELSGRQVTINASIGVAFADKDGLEAVELVRRADTAMYTAKRGGGAIAVFDDEADARHRAEQATLDELRVLLGTDEDPRFGHLTVLYQPQVDSRARVVGAEALVRWQHPHRGLLTPDRFLALAESNGLMSVLTARVMTAAVQQASTWARAGLDLAVAVNLSSSCLTEPRLLPLIDDLLSTHDLDPGRLVIEITETEIMRDTVSALNTMRQITDRGVSVSIDDYGTGYSSLAYLNSMPAHELKVDRAFTQQVRHDPRTAAIVAATIDLAHHLGLRLVAEGVEDTATGQALIDMGVDTMQGYLYGKPMTPQQLSRIAAPRTEQSPGTAAGVLIASTE